MAEPALALLPRQDGGFDCYQAQWGGRREVLARIFDCGSERKISDPYRALLDTEWSHERIVYPPASDTIDYHRTAAVYLVTAAGIAVFLPVWFGFPPTVELEATAGALLRVHSLAAFQHIRTDVRRFKGRLGRSLARGECSLAEAVQWLYERVSRREIHESSQLRRICGGPTGEDSGG